ncbi:glycosyltransferase family 39 protein [Streptomyces sp. NPDC059802]|uniref:glycosyltransferase family 39 protein n=1 Tax=Streptomyces sp. NPDC059802 TaxID=3346952 RepID=UPI003650FF1E
MRDPHRTEHVISLVEHSSSTPSDALTEHRPPPSRSPLRRWAPWAPGLMALLVGLWGIRRQGTLWGDEAVTYAMAHRDVPQIRHTLSHIDAVHGLYYLLMRGVFILWDGGLVALRLPSVLAVAAAAVGIVRIGQRLGATRAGLLAGAVFPLLPPVQRYAQEGRSYALVCALVTWASWLLVSNLSRPRRRGWVAYGAVILTACLLHELAVLIVLAHGVTVFRTRRERPERRAWSVAAGGVLAGLLPLAAFSTTQSEQVDWIGPPDAGAVLGFVVTALLGIAFARVPRPSHGARLATSARFSHGAPVATGARLSRGPVPLSELALPLLILPPALLMLTSPLHPLYVDRYVLASAIGFALLTGSMLDRLGRSARSAGTVRRVTWAVALAAVLLALVPVSIALRKPESRENDAVAIARTVRKVAEPGDGLLFTPIRRRVWTLARPDDFRALTDLALERTPVESGTLSGRELPPDRIRERMLADERIVVVRDLAGRPLETDAREVVKRATLDEFFEECTDRTVTQARITVFARPGHCRTAPPRPAPGHGPGPHRPGTAR